MEPIAYTVDQATKVVPFSRSRLYELMKEGTLPFGKQGGRTFIRRVDLLRLVDENMVVQ